MGKYARGIIEIYVNNKLSDVELIFKTLKSIINKMLMDNEDNGDDTVYTLGFNIVSKLIPYEKTWNFLTLVGFETDDTQTKFYCEKKLDDTILNNIIVLLNPGLYKKVDEKYNDIKNDDDDNTNGK